MSPFSPPKAKQIKKKLEKHGDIRVDPWFWLKNSEDPEVLSYLKKENSYTHHILEKNSELELQVYDEILKKIREKDQSIPVLDGEYWYYSEINKGQQYSVYKRTKQLSSQHHELLLDLNNIAKDLSYCDLGTLVVSPNHRYLAYSLDEEGDEKFTIYIKDLFTGSLLDDRISSATECLEWTNDSKGFYYCKLDKNHRPLTVYSHKLASPIKDDLLVYQEKDERFFVSLDKSESEKYIYICSEGNNMSEWYYIDAKTLDSKPQLINERSPNHEYEVSDHGDEFIIRTNLNALDFKIVRTNIRKPKQENWKDLLPSQEGVAVECFMLLKKYLIIQTRSLGTPNIFVYHFDDQQIEELEWQEEIFELELIGLKNYENDFFRYSIQSLKSPSKVFDYHIQTKTHELKKETVLPDPTFNEANYVVKKLKAPTHDGAYVPISLIIHKDNINKPDNPAFVYAYGAYGEVLEADFNSYFFSLLDRGFVVALVHVRGGADLGQKWYHQGKLLHKKNTFADYITATKYLISNSYTIAGKVIAYGGSAGGMLMGVVANECPQLYASIIAEVPFVDVLTTMLDDSLPLTTLEYNEWGNPNMIEYYQYIKSYSPYDNIKKQVYPSMLVLSGFSDTRVTYWEPAKWVAKLRHYNSGNRPILLKMNFDTGHGGASGRYDSIKEISTIVSYAINSIYKQNGAE